MTNALATLYEPFGLKSVSSYLQLLTSCQLHVELFGLKSVSSYFQLLASCQLQVVLHVEYSGTDGSKGKYH
jgi:hypothetical protein